MRDDAARQARAELGSPRLPAADRLRLAALATRTVLVRSELRAALRELSAVAESLHAAAQGAPGDDELRNVITAAAQDARRHVDELAAGVEGFELQLRERPERLVAAFFGRTMAGKTTLVETLVGGDGSAIGRGGQRTTQTTRHCPWGDITLCDTPGIGAFEGEEDARIARRDVRDADLVVFVLTDDSIQEEHFRALEHVRAENKPILFLLNAKLAVSEPLLRKRFLSDPSAFLGDAALRGHLDRLDELARGQLGLSDFQVLAVQAQAAWLGSTEGDQELLAASGLEQVIDVVSDIVATRAVQLRIRSTYDPSVLHLERTAGDLTLLVEELRRQSTVFRERADALEREVTHVSVVHHARVQRTIAAHLGARREELVAWLDTHISARDLSDRIEAWLAVDSLENDLRHDVESAFDALESICASALRHLVDDLEVRVTADFRQDGFHFTDWRKALTALRRALQVGGLLFKVARLTKWGKRLGGAGGPVGWVVLIGTELLAQLAKRAPQYNPARRLYLQKAAARLDRSIVELGHEATESACGPLSHVIKEGTARRLIDDLTSSAEQLAALAGELDLVVNRIRDRATRLSASMCEDLLNGQRPTLWCRLPGEALALRGSLRDDAREALQAATGEVALELPGSATDAIRHLAPGSDVEWRQESIVLSTNSATIDPRSKRLIERIAERPVVVIDDPVDQGQEP